MNKKSKKGFTLVELLVVIAIIGILAAVGVTALSGARAKARDAARVANIKQIQSALELYYNDNQIYPVGTALAIGSGITVNDCTTACDTISSAGIAQTAVAPVYMAMIPKDPSAALATECAHPAAAVCQASYSAFKANGTACVAGEICTAYEITTWLEGATGGFTAGALCATQNGVGATCP